MLNPKVTVIVPVYNVERYLEECLDSLKSQSYKDYEVLVIDDCSPDNSVDIIKRYLALYPDRFRYVRTPENVGVGKARDYGIENARGEYLMFVDSDDVVSCDFIEIPMKTLVEHNADFVEFNYISFKNTPPPATR